MEIQPISEEYSVNYPERAAMTKYGLFCPTSPSPNKPIMAFYTRFAAEKKCRELNTRDPGVQWFIRRIAE